MSILQYCNDIESMCDTDRMSPFQNPRIDTVGESFDEMPHVLLRTGLKQPKI
jgi:hypothetical protein